MKCRDFRELIDSYLSDELLTETNHDVLRHLEECADCRRETEVRRNLLLRMRSAVKNSPEFQIRPEFSKNLRAQLRQSTKAKTVFWTNKNSWMAIAATLILTLGLGFWIFQKSPVASSKIAQNENSQFVALDTAALGDHQNCAVKFNLPEAPVAIDLASPKYASLREAIVEPLQKSDGKYELIESHVCKYDGRLFTHIVFRHQDRTVSVLLTDLQNNKPLKDEEILKVAAGGYQLARFDANNQAIFVVSDFPQAENSAMAEMLVNPVRKNFKNFDQTKLALLGEL